MLAKNNSRLWGWCHSPVTWSSYYVIVVWQDRLYPYLWPSVSLGSTIPMTLHWTSSLDNGWMGKCWITANSRNIYCCHNKKRLTFSIFITEHISMTTLSNESLSRRIIQAFPNNRPMTVCLQRECTGTAYLTIQLLLQAPENTTENIVIRYHRSNGKT